MNLRIEFHSNNHSFSAEKQINDRSEITASFVEEAIKDYVNNNYVFDDEECAALDEYPIMPHGYYDDISKLSDDIYRTAIDALPKIISPFEIEYFVNGEPFDNTIEMNINEVIRSIIADHLEERKIDCQSNIDVGAIILKSLALFYDQGTWHEGFLRDDGFIILSKEQWPNFIEAKGKAIWADNTHTYKPIVWFGMQDELPLQYWSLGAAWCQSTADSDYKWTEDSWKDMWFDYDMQWNILSNYNYPMYDWLFIECGEVLPDIDPVIKTCPVELLESDSTEELHRKIEEHFKSIVLNM